MKILEGPRHSWRFSTIFPGRKSVRVCQKWFSGLLSSEMWSWVKIWVGKQRSGKWAKLEHGVSWEYLSEKPAFDVVSSGILVVYNVGDDRLLLVFWHRGFLASSGRLRTILNSTTPRKKHNFSVLQLRGSNAKRAALAGNYLKALFFSHDPC